LNLFYGSNGAPIDPDATYELEINNPFDRSNRRGSIATFKIPIGRRK
jgi:hypothetical protein